MDESGLKWQGMNKFRSLQNRLSVPMGEYCLRVGLGLLERYKKPASGPSVEEESIENNENMEHNHQDELALRWLGDLQNLSTFGRRKIFNSEMGCYIRSAGGKSLPLQSKN